MWHLDHFSSLASHHWHSPCLFRVSLLFIFYFCSFCFWLSNCHRLLNVESILALPFAIWETLVPSCLPPSFTYHTELQGALRTKPGWGSEGTLASDGGIIANELMGGAQRQCFWSGERQVSPQEGALSFFVFFTSMKTFSLFCSCIPN